MPGTTGQPRVGLLTQVPVTWVDGTPFNGYLLVGLVLPSDGVTPWAEGDFGNVMPGLQLPIWQMIPIVAGLYNPVCGCYFNSDIMPPVTYYVAYYYDAGLRQIAGPSAGFQVSTSPFTPPVLALADPTTLGTPPLPDPNASVPSGGGSGGGGGGTVTPYTQALTAVTTVTVTAATHGKGAFPLAYALDNATPANYTAIPFAVAANGDLTATFNLPFTGTLVIY